MIGEVPVERVGLLDGRRQACLADPVSALVAREQELGGRFRVMRLRGNVSAARLDGLERDRSVGADEGAGGALHVELGPAHRGDVGLQKLGFAAIGPGHTNTNLVLIGDVVPHALVPVRLDDPWTAVEELEHPVDVVRSPVVPGAAGDGRVRVPRPAGMRVAAHERLHVEDLAEEPGADGAPYGHEVGIPSAVLVDRQHTAARRRRRDDLVGLGDGQTQRLLAGDVLARAQELQGQRHVVSGRRRHERYLDIIVADQLAHRRVRPDARKVRLRRLPALDVRVDDGDQLEPLGPHHAEPVVVAHGPERTIPDDPHSDVAPAAVQVGAQRPRE